MQAKRASRSQPPSPASNNRKRMIKLHEPWGKEVKGRSSMSRRYRMNIPPSLRGRGHDAQCGWRSPHTGTPRPATPPTTTGTPLPGTESPGTLQGQLTTPSMELEAGLRTGTTVAPSRVLMKPRKRHTPWKPYEVPGSLRGKLLTPFREEIKANLKSYASGLEQALRAEFEVLRSEIGTSMEALEGRLSAFETQANTQLEALEAKLALFDPRDLPSEQRKPPRRPQHPQWRLLA
ncbi:hypothetical protein RJZ56_003244 [Blastomyces dermatitidis]|uniref:Uncharacterized protein n=3 Tax=Blastomyces TaxID=229219 RepID=A0A179UND1_BLAGS|nr:uncharacterized protein BDBG_05253 [Blastomyces gilchristii SLH14081]XP_045281800.1 uncharacterized protein BDCG_17368 [Blastomyces dermatitidis ER-3]EGE85662.1 hypothetical protein BDDG_08607 [Blastomyces dermatitidis ATCC 18188]EQL33836.1 hypothetical protein BDFG_04220 [Blastomyces dermatitidis ATCC 26199]OAT02073.1 hypothetical protein BDCG_17368 [Blastomyces dermatitidis ER-3]OAT09484.1 hypothetical protein BDBG_05253 [Blastomyces gilchristii SLH14081]